MRAVPLVLIARGNSALVVGAGTIGLFAQQALKVAGCVRVFFTDIGFAATRNAPISGCGFGFFLRPKSG